jgi:hypothetical protein
MDPPIILVRIEERAGQPTYKVVQTLCIQIRAIVGS